MAARTSQATAERQDGHGHRGNGARRLVIVESPAKARTIAGYLGKGYVVESSIGHIRDMPGSAADIPDNLRKEPWARLGVNIDADFEPLYVVNADKRQQVSKLKKLLKDADELLLATDEDREGEAIAWHLVQELKPKVPAKRMVFHEITPEAIAAAVASPREMDDGLVEAYQTRRVLDRLYGYEVSPGAVEEGHAAAVGRPGAVGRGPAGRGPGEGADRVPAGPYWDLEAEFAAAATADADVDLVHARRWWRSTAAGSPRAATSRSTGELRRPHGREDSRRAGPAPGRGGGGRRWRPAERSVVHASSRSSASRTAARRTRRSARPRCSRKPRASWASRPSTRCRWRSGCTRTVTSPICGPTRSTLSQTAITAARSAGARAVRRRVRAGRAAHLHQQGQERPGGARGDPPGRRPFRRPARPGCPATSCGCTS